MRDDFRNFREMFCSLYDLCRTTATPYTQTLVARHEMETRLMWLYDETSRSDFKDCEDEQMKDLTMKEIKTLKSYYHILLRKEKLMRARGMDND